MIISIGAEKAFNRIQQHIKKLTYHDHMDFIFQFVNMVYHIDLFVYIEESFHLWDKAHLIMMYELFNVLLDSVC